MIRRLLYRWLKVDEIDRNARAYGWEVGQGLPMNAVLKSTPGNPFLAKDWRDQVTS